MGWRRPLLIFLTLSVAGCFPVPHDVPLLPAVEGEVLRAGRPVVGARIYASEKVATENVCESTRWVTATDAHGAFTIPAKMAFRLFISMSDPYTTWTVCIEDVETIHVGWSSHYTGYPPERVRLRCDLDNPTVEHSDGTGLCELSED